MRRLIQLFLTLTVLTGTQITWGQTSNPGFTATDPDSQTWNNGTYSVVLVSSSGQAVPQGQAIRVDTGVTVTVSVSSQTLNGSGAGSITLVNNSNILPAGTQWKFNVCSNTLPQFCGTSILTISSSSSISSQISASLPAPRIGGGIGAQGYADVEASAIPNNSYYNVTTPACRLYTSSWGACGGGSSTLPTATAQGQALISTAAGTTYAAQFPLAPNVPVEAFGAVGDYSGSGSGGTDNTTAIQACFNSFSSTAPGNCLLGPHKYKVTGTLTINHSAVGLVGSTYGAISTAISNQLAANVPASSIYMTSATADIIDVWGASISAPLSFNQFRDFTMMRTVTATTTSSGGCGASGNLGPAGLSIKFNGGAQISNVWSEDSACGIYQLNAGAFGTGYIENSGVLWGFNAGCPTISVYGIFIDGGQSAESARIRHSFAETNNCPGQQSVGLIVTGADLNDIFVDNFETAFVTFGKYIQFTTGGCTVCSSDIHLINSVDDTFFTTGTTITGLTQANGCAVEISGGWESSNGTGDGVAIASSCGVTVDHVHFLFNNGMANGVHATSSGQIGIANNYFLVEATAATAVINLNTVANATVTGNVIAGKSGSTQTDILCVSCTRSVFTGNTLSGFAATGISMDAGSTNNSFLGVNAIDPTNITTQVSNLGTNNTFDGVGGLIAKKTGTGTPTSITFSSIPQTYQNLKLMGNFVLTGGANLVANFNGDSTAAHYAYGLNYENNGSTGQTASNSSTHSLIAGAQGAVEVEIPSYTAGVGGGVNFTGNFSAMTIGSATLSGAVGGLWNGTDVTSLTLADSSGTAAFTAGSVFSLYGLN